VSQATAAIKYEASSDGTEDVMGIFMNEDDNQFEKSVDNK